MSDSSASERLFMDTDHTDVVFVVEGQEIPGHRAAFAASCPYFANLLNSDFVQSDRVEISGTSAQVFNEIKSYIYSGQLTTARWNIKDLLGLLSVAHEYQYQALFTEVVVALEKRSLDFRTWTLVHSAAAIYDSVPLKAICVPYAEAQLDHFLCLNHMDMLPEELICFMFDTPKIRTVNQDKLLSALLQWKKTHRSAQIRSMVKKISWNEVSQNIAAKIAQLFLLNLQNEDEVPFWNQMVDEIQMQSHCIARLDNILLKTTPVKCQMKIPEAIMYCYLIEDYIHINFMKNGHGSSYESFVKGIQFELSNEYHIRRVGGQIKTRENKEMDLKRLGGNHDWSKYIATYSEAERIHYIRIHSDKFTEVPEITLLSILIY